MDFMVFETPNLPAEFWDDAIARTVEEFPEYKINKIVPPNVGTMGDYLKQLQATDQFPDVMMSNFAVAEFIEAGLLLPYEDADLVRFVDPVGPPQFHLVLLPGSEGHVGVGLVSLGFP